MTTMLVRGGIVVTEQGRRGADVLCRDGRIVAVGDAIEAPGAAEIINADGCYVMPGGIDPHTHMQLPMMNTVVADDFFTGTAAAAAGGTTTILDFVGPEPGQSPLEALKIWRDRAAKATIDYGFHMTVSWWGEAFSSAMPTLVNDHGITSFKFFLAYKGRLMLSDEDLLAGFRRCRELGALVQVHAENGELIAYLQQKVLADGITSPLGHALSRPSQCEGEATLRAITMAEILDVPLYVVHVSAAEAADAIGKARRRGVKVIGETLPGFLAIDDSVYRAENFDIAAGHVMSPPYRPKQHQDAIWQAIETGALSTTGTDHCCFTKAQKRLGRADFTKIPNGCGGVEERLHVLWHLGVNGRRFTPEQLRRADIGKRGQGIQPVATQRLDRGRRRCRPYRARSGADEDPLGGDPTSEHRLLGLGGDADQGRGNPHARARPPCLGGRRFARRAGHRQLCRSATFRRGLLGKNLAPANRPSPRTGY